jgi:hypothetical protein
VTQLNTKLDDLLGPMNVIKRILHDLSHFLPTAISMVQACEMRDNEVSWIDDAKFANDTAAPFE